MSIHQNHPLEGTGAYAAFKRSTPYLCETLYTPADGAGVAWHNAQAAVTCPDCRSHHAFGLSETAIAILAGK